MSNASEIRWLHISDLNLRPEGSFSYDVALSRLVDSYSSRTLSGAELDFIFCTGDIAFSGKAEEYTVATRFFDKLSEVTRVPLDRIFTVPGNHDVDRSRLAHAFRLHLPDMESSTAFLSSEEDLSIAFRSIQNYVAFEHRVFGRIWSPSVPFISVRSNLRGLNVAVLGFNTAWVTNQEDQVPKQVVGYRLVQGALSQVRKENPDLTIVLMHHPISWLAPYERTHMERLFSRHADFVLHSHVHSPQGYDLSASSEGAVLLGAGSWSHNGDRGRSIINVSLTDDRVLVRPGFYVEKGAQYWELPTGSERTLAFHRARLSVDPAGPATLRFPFDVSRYITDLERLHGTLSMGGLDLERSSPSISLESIFVTPELQMERRDELTQETGGAQEVVDVEVLLNRSQRVFVVGDPGVGKTTLLKGLLLGRARRLLNTDRRQLGSNAVLPVLIPLRQLADALVTRVDSAVDVLQHLVYKTTEPYGADLNWVRHAFRSASILLLFDGLDEIAPKSVRADCVRLLNDLTTQFPQVPMVITSRPMGFSSIHEIGLPSGFLVCHLRPFSESQVDAFITRVFKTLVRDTHDAERRAADLLAILRSDSSLAGLAASPLMLWAIVLTFRTSRFVPGNRVEVYRRTIDLLLGTWDRSKGIRPRPLYEALFLSRLFEEVALAVHQRGPGRPVLSSSELHQILVRAITVPMETETAPGLSVQEMVERTGLLVSPQPGLWQFVHRSFQEYLAALAILRSKDTSIDLLCRHMADPEWREVVLWALAISWAKDRDFTFTLFDRLTRYVTEELAQGQQPDAWGLLASAAMDTDLTSRKFQPIVARLCDSAVKIVEDSRQPGSRWSRRQLARLLGMLGDPRLGWNDDRHLVIVPSGMVVLGGLDPLAVKDETPAHKVFVSTFLVGRYLVTNSQFTEFVEDGAYHKEKYWAGDFGRRTDIPSFLETLRVAPNMPVTEVSWFEADAYCRWLNDTRPRPDGLRWRLPTEAEWEKAARGGMELGTESGTTLTGRTYPWGNEWSADRANVGGSSDGPTAVGLFPSGVGPYGTFDQSGNVSEWCQDGFWTYGGPQRSDPLGMTSSAIRAVRGGDWTSSPREVRVSSRNWCAPAERRRTIGFRVVASAVAPVPARPPNPFRPGIVLSTDAPPPGRVELIAELTSRIEDGGSCVLLGPRRSGKTSILRYLATALGQRQRVRFLDLQGHPCRTPDVLAASLEPTLSEHPHPATELRRLMATEEAPVILLDELGRLRNVAVDEDPNVFEWLRSLGQVGVALVLAGTEGDWDVAQAKDAEKPGSSFANIMKPMHLGPLQKSEALAFLTDTAPDDVPIGTDHVGRWMVEFTGGWPFYLQVLAHAYVEERRARRIPLRPTDREIRRLYESALLHEYEFVFRQRWQELGRRAQRVLLQGMDGQLPDPLRLSPSDIQHIERQGLFHQQHGWLLAGDKPFLDWIGIHHRALVPEGEGKV